MRFTRLKIGQSETKELTVKNGINEPSIVGTVKKPFSFVSLKEIKGEFPASETIYFRENYTLQDENGDFATENQGFGVAGSTDANKKFTPDFAFPVVNITGPTDGAKYKIDQSITITWESSNIDALDLVVESGSGLLEVNDIDASLGTYTFNLTAGIGAFGVNQDISISLTDCMGVAAAAADTVNIASIATLTMEAPALTAGTEGTITGTSNGSVVDVYSRVSSPKGEWELFDGDVAVDESGNWTATGTIATAGTRDFVAVDTTDSDGFVQVDDVVVASGYEEGKIMIAVPATTNNPLKYSNDFGANFVTKGAQMPYIWLDINESGSHAICINAQGVYTVINGIYATAINSAKNWHMCAISKTGQYMVAVYGTTNTTGGIYISSDYGATWSETKTGVGGYAVCMSENGDKIAVFVYQGKSWFSSDYGQNWTERGATKAWAYSQNSRPCMSKDGAYVYAITTDKDYVYRFSSNGSSVTAVMPSKNYNSISCSEDGSKLVAGVYNENLYYSSNYGSSNSSIKSGGFRHVVMSGNGNYIAVCDNSQSNLSVAQTPFSSWADKGGSGFNCIRISYSGQYIIAVTGTSGNLFRSINYGANFGNVALGNNNWSTCVMNTKR